MSFWGKLGWEACGIHPTLGDRGAPQGWAEEAHQENTGGFWGAEGALRLPRRAKEGYGEEGRWDRNASRKESRISVREGEARGE